MTEALMRYRSAVEEGVLKIMSKMGISTTDSYRGAQIFDAIGIGQELIDLAFTGTPSPLGGIGMTEIAEDTLRRHAEGYKPKRPRWPTPATTSTTPTASSTPPTRTLSTRSRRPIKTEDWAPYGRFAEMVASRRQTEPRDLLEFMRRRRADPGRGGRAGRGDHPPFLQRGDQPRRDRGRGPRGDSHRLEHGRRLGQQRRGRRVPQPLPHREAVQDQADRFGTFRRDPRVRIVCRGAADQGGPGLQAGRGRPDPRPQGERGDRQAAAHPARALR